MNGAITSLETIYSQVLQHECSADVLKTFMSNLNEMKKECSQKKIDEEKAKTPTAEELAMEKRKKDNIMQQARFRLAQQEWEDEVQAAMVELKRNGGK